MRHAEDGFFQTQLGRLAQRRFDAHDGEFAAIQAETLGAGVFQVQELFKGLGDRG